MATSFSSLKNFSWPSADKAIEIVKQPSSNSFLQKNKPFMSERELAEEVLQWRQAQEFKIRMCIDTFRGAPLIFDNSSTAEYTDEGGLYQHDQDTEPYGPYAKQYARAYGVTDAITTYQMKLLPEMLLKYAEPCGLTPCSYEVLQQFSVPEYSVAALSFIEQHRRYIQDTAWIISQRHGLSTELVELVLIFTAFGEMMAINDVDRIQDTAACELADCKMQKAFEMHFDDYPGIIERTGWRALTDEEDSPFWKSAVWFGASYYTGQPKPIPMARQGFGPLQIILGNPREAARDSQAMADFAGRLNPADFEDGKKSLDTIVDPKKMFYAKGIMLSHALSKIRGSLPPSEKMSEIPSIDNVPDREIGLQLKMLIAAQHVSAFPEDYKKVPRIFCQHTTLHDYFEIYIPYLVALGEIFELDHPLGLELRHLDSNTFTVVEARNYTPELHMCP